MVGQASIDAGLADPLSHANDEDEDGEQDDAHRDVDGHVSLDPVDDECCRRVGKEEQANHADPEHPPRNGIAAPFVGGPPAQGADETGGQGKAHGDQCRGLKIESVFRDVVFRKPEGEGDKPPEHEVVGKTESPDTGLHERRHLIAERREAPFAAALLELGIGVGEKPESDGHHHHGHRVDLRDGAPTQSHDDQRSGQVGDRRSGVAGAEDAHRRALLLLGKPGGRVGDTDREGAARKPHEQTDDQVLPILIRERQPVAGDGDQDHLDEKNDASAKAVGQHPEGQTHERTGQDRRRHQQAELRFVEAEFALDLDANHRKHRPHREIDREGQRVHGEDRILLPRVRGGSWAGRFCGVSGHDRPFLFRLNLIRCS